MRVCHNCGTKNFDVDTTCGKCHAPLLSKVDKVLGVQPNMNSQGDNQRVAVSKNNPVSITAKVFLILSCVQQGLLALVCMLLFVFAGEINNVYGGAIEIVVQLYAIVMWISVAQFVISIFMTSSYSRKIYERKKIGVAFKVCTLIIVNLVAGILMLCDNEHP